jgi:hypothetical protein
MREVSDLGLVALLRLRGHRPVRVRGDGQRAWWEFDPTPQVERDVAEFYAGTLMVPARDFAEAIRSAKGEAMQLKYKPPARPGQE